EASGPHDFAVRTCVVRQRAVNRSRTFRSALPSRHTPNAVASTASHPASVTIAIRPCRRRDGAGYRFDLGQARTGKILEIGRTGGNQIDLLQESRPLQATRCGNFLLCREAVLNSSYFPSILSIDC